MLVGLLLAWGGVRVGEVLAALARLDPGVYLLALGVQAAIYLLRALRFRLLLPSDPRVSFARVLPVTAAHGLAAYVLPAKVGEASLIVYLKGACGTAGWDAAAVLLLSRLLDLATVAGSLSLACIVLSTSGVFAERGLDWLGGLGAALFVLMLAFGWASARGERLAGWVEAFLRGLGLSRTRLGAGAERLAARLRDALARVGAGRLRAGALLSLPVWLCVYLFYAVLARGLGLSDLSFFEAIFGSSLAVLANLLPINGFAGFGTQDAGWVVGFGAVGVERELALESALAFHLVYLFNIVAFGVAGHLGMGMGGSVTGTGSGARWGR